MVLVSKSSPIAVFSAQKNNTKGGQTLGIIGMRLRELELPRVIHPLGPQPRKFVTSLTKS
jgi:hypothetical protein